MRFPHIGRLGPAWLLAVLTTCAALAATAWQSLAPSAAGTPAAFTPAPAMPGGGALFSALATGQTALLQEDLQAIAQLVREIDPAASDAVIPLRERMDALLRREERAASAAPPAMVLAQFAASLDGAAAALAAEAASGRAAATTLSPILGLAAALIALLATPLALLRLGRAGETAGERTAAIATRLDGGVRSVLDEMARFRGDVSQARQSFSQAQAASERLASVAEIVGERVVQTALAVERAAEQTTDLPARILDQAEMLAEISRSGKDSAALLVRLIDDAAERDTAERARIDALAGAIETLRGETERCVGGLQPLAEALASIAALPAIVETAVDRAAAVAGARMATAGVESIMSIASETIAPQVAAFCGEAIRSLEAEAASGISRAVSTTLGSAEEALRLAAADATRHGATVAGGAIESLAGDAAARLAEVLREAAAEVSGHVTAASGMLDSAAAPLRILADEAGGTVAAMAELRRTMTEDAQARPAIAEAVSAGIVSEVQQKLASGLAPLSEAIAGLPAVTATLKASAAALAPIPAATPAFAGAAAALAEAAGRQDALLGRLDGAIEALRAVTARAPDPAPMLALAQRLGEHAETLGALRRDIPALVSGAAPAPRRMDARAAATTRLAGPAPMTGEPAADTADARAAAILSGLSPDAAGPRTIDAIRAALAEMDVVQDAVARLALEAEQLAADVVGRRHGALPPQLQDRLPALLTKIDDTIGRLDSAATAIASATDGPDREGLRRNRLAGPRRAAKARRD